MAHNPIYERLLLEVTPGLKREIMRVLLDHIGANNRISRKDLLTAVFHNKPELFARITDAEDRKLRLAIAELQQEGYPILSDSAEGGRWLALPDEIEAYVAELESRIEKLREKILALRQGEHKMVWVEPEKPPMQGRLF